MHPVVQPVESLANCIGELYQTKTASNKILSASITATVFPIFLALELIFIRLPQLLSLQFTANRTVKNQCTKKIQELALSTFMAPGSLLVATFNYRIILAVTEKFMSHRVQYQIIQDNYADLNWASDELKNSRFIVLEAVRQNYLALRYATNALKNDRAFILEAIKLDIRSLYFASDQLKNDRELIFEAVLNYPRALQYASQALKNDPEIVLLATQNDAYSFKFASNDLRNDPEFILRAIHRNSNTLIFAPETFKNDRVFVLDAIKLNGYAFNYVSETLKNDRDFVLEAVEINILSLNFASEIYKNDPEVVLTAIYKNGHALEFASDLLKNDYEIVLEAVRLNAGAIYYASDNLKNNRELLSVAIDLDETTFCWASDDLKNDREFILDAIWLNVDVLKYVSDSFKNDYEFMLDAIWINIDALHYASDDLKNNRKFILKAIRLNVEALYYASDELKNDPQVALKAIRVSLDAILWISDDLKSHREFIFDSIKLNIQGSPLLADSKMSDRTIILTAIKKNPYALEFASDDLKNDPEIVLEAVNLEGITLKFASDNLKNDPKIVLAAVKQNSFAFDYASVDLQNNAEFKQTVLFARVPDNLCLIGGRRYFPNALNPELKNLQLPPLPHDVSIEHLQSHLSAFINNLQKSHLQTLRNELGLDTSYSLQDCKDLLSRFIQLLFERLKNKEAYIGTPPKDSAELDSFYKNIEFYLKHLDHFFSKPENQLPEAFIERLQLLQTQSACGARFQAETEQLFCLNCLPLESMALDKRLAIIASTEAKKIIESMVLDSNVHEINNHNWQLNSYLVGPQVVKDHLSHPSDHFFLMDFFLSKHTSINLVDQILKTLKLDSDLEMLFSSYIKENFSYELNKTDEIEIANRAISFWKDQISLKISKLQEYQDAVAGIGPYQKIKNRQILLKILGLTQDEASCKNRETLIKLLESTKTISINTLKETAKKNYITEKTYEKYFDLKTNQWKGLTIALALEKMGIFVGL